MRRPLRALDEVDLNPHAGRSIVKIFFYGLFQRRKIGRRVVKVRNGFRQRGSGKVDQLALETPECSGRFESLFNESHGVVCSSAFDEMKGPPVVALLVRVPGSSLESGDHL